MTTLATAEFWGIPIDEAHEKVFRQLPFAIGTDSVDAMRRYLYEVHGILPGESLPVAKLADLLEEDLLKRLESRSRQPANSENSPIPSTIERERGFEASATGGAGYQMTPAEQRLVDTIREVGHRMTGKETLDYLGKRGIIASVGTTKVYLSGLRKQGILTNRQDVRPKGYGLAEWG